MRHLVKSFTTFGLIALLAVPAMAQRPGGGLGYGRMEGPSLLMDEGVRQELKLDEQQVGRVKEMAREIAEARREQREVLQSATPEERREKIEAILRADNEKTQTALRKILKPEQLRRYEQIDLQQQGLRAFASSDVQGRLKLTEAQREQLRTMSDDFQAQMREAMQSTEGTVQERREKIEARQKEQMEKAAAMLDADQKATWQELIGAPYQVRSEDGPPGGPGGNRPGARRPGTNP